MFQVTQIVRFLLERGLRFRNLGFCGHWHDLINVDSDLQCAGTDLPGRTRRLQGLVITFSRHFLKAMPVVHLSVIRILRLRPGSASEI